MLRLIQWKLSALVLTACLFAGASTAHAQSAPADEKASADPGNWSGTADQAPALDDSTPPALPPVGGPVPSSNDADVAANAPAPGGRVELTEAERRKAARNRKAAISSLNGLLQDKTTDYKTAKQRVDNLKALIKKYETQLASSGASKQQMQVELFRRTLTLKQQHDAGRVPKDIYEKRLAEENQRYVAEKSRLERDIKFNSEELKQLRPKLADLESQLQTMQITRPELKNINKPKVTPAQQLLGKVDKTLRGLVDFKVKGSLGSSRLDGHP